MEDKREEGIGSEEEKACNVTEDKNKLKLHVTAAASNVINGDTGSQLLRQDVGVCRECQKRRTQGSMNGTKKRKVKPCYKFVWNKYLLRNFESVVHPDWVLHIINGFVGQSGILRVVFRKNRELNPIVECHYILRFDI